MIRDKRNVRISFRMPELVLLCLLADDVLSAVAAKSDLIPADQAPLDTIQVLAACHSLVLLDDKTIGDPLEKVTLEAIKWNVTKADAVVPVKGKQAAVKIHQRFHFSRYEAKLRRKRKKLLLFLSIALLQNYFYGIFCYYNLTNQHCLIK